MTTPSQLFPNAGQANLIFQEGSVRQKVQQGGSFTVPRTRNVAGPSVSGGSSGSLGAVAITQGMVFGISSNDAGVNEMATFEPVRITGEDVIAVTVAANVLTLTLNGTSVFSVTGTALTTAQALLYFF